MKTSVESAVAESSGTSDISALHIALIIAVFLSALAATCGLVGRYLPIPEAPVVWEKLEKLKRYGDDYDIFFIGSSRVHYQVMPSIFDAALHERSETVRSFNAGVGAMRPPEDCYFLDQVLRCPHRRLRWVFLEVMPMRIDGDPILRGTGRYTYWRDWERTRMLTEGFIDECGGAWRKFNHNEASWTETMQACNRSLGVWLDNLRLFVQNGSNLGRGEALLAGMTGHLNKRKHDARITDPSWDGWAKPVIAKPISASARSRAAYEQAYASLLDAKERFEAGDRVSVEALSAKVQRLRDAGVTPVLIIPPATVATRFYPYQFADGKLTILDFSDPREYPELFSVDHRLDSNHLDAAGSELFTKAIARKFLESLGKRAQSP